MRTPFTAATGGLRSEKERVTSEKTNIDINPTEKSHVSLKQRLRDIIKVAGETYGRMPQHLATFVAIFLSASKHLLLRTKEPRQKLRPYGRDPLLRGDCPYHEEIKRELPSSPAFH